MGRRRHILVTGASSGIGRAITEQLLDAGHCVVGIAREAGALSGLGGRFSGYAIDLARLDRVPVQLQALVESETGLDGVVCCAGAGRFGSLEEFSYAQVRALIDLNLSSQIFVARAVLPVLKRRGEGDILFIGSEAGVSGGRRGAVYSAAKAGLRGLAQALRQECAPRGVRVGIINPGMVKTRFYEGLAFGPGEAPENYILPEDVAELVLEVLMLRPGTVIDEINLSPLKKVVRVRGKP